MSHRELIGSAEHWTSVFVRLPLLTDRLSSLCSTGLLCSVLLLPSAQEASSVPEPPKRQKLIGVARDLRGRPWVGATVMLYSRPYADCEKIGELDLIRVRTDGRGRFAARLITRRRYHAWAFVHREKGVYRCSRMHYNVFARTPLSLHEESVRQRLRIEVSADENMAGRGPFQVLVHGGRHSNVWLMDRGGQTAPGTLLPVELDAGGRALLPAVPWLALSIEIRDRSGGLVFFGDYDAAGFDADDLDPDEPDLIGIELRRRAERKVRVVEASSKKPIAGARIYQKVRGSLFPVATTDRQGFARTSYPVRVIGSVLGTGRAPALIVNAEGFAWQVPMPSAFDINLIRLMAGYTVRGRVLLAGRPLKRVPLLFFPGSTSIARGLPKRSGPITYRTDEEGRFEIRSVHRGVHRKLYAVLGQSLLDALPDSRGFPTAGTAILAYWNHDRPDLGDLELSELHALDIQVSTADGIEADRPEILIVDPEFNKRRHFAPMKLFTDRSGRLRVLLPARKRLELVAISDQGYARTSSVIVGGGSSRRTLLDMTLSRALSISGRVYDVDDNPVSGAVVSAAASVPKRSGWSSLESHLGDLLHARTDAQGRYCIWIPFGSVNYGVQARYRKSFSSNAGVSVEREPVTGIELQLGR